MIEIQAHSLSKRYKKEWIFKSFDYTFTEGSWTTLIGANGSGKSTLLKVLSSFEKATDGKIIYKKGGVGLTEDEWYKELSWVGPYTKLIEEFTLEECFNFHQSFKPLEIPFSDFLKKTEMEKHKYKPLKAFSSGMLQKIKLGLGLYAHSSVLFLDEPTSNLDQKNVEWFLTEFSLVRPRKLTIMASNILSEHEDCQNIIDIRSFR